MSREVNLADEVKKLSEIRNVTLFKNSLKKFLETGYELTTEQKLEFRNNFKEGKYNKTFSEKQKDIIRKELYTPIITYPKTVVMILLVISFLVYLGQFIINIAKITIPDWLVYTLELLGLILPGILFAFMVFVMVKYRSRFGLIEIILVLLLLAMFAVEVVYFFFYRDLLFATAGYNLGIVSALLILTFFNTVTFKVKRTNVSLEKEREKKIEETRRKEENEEKEQEKRMKENVKKATGKPKKSGTLGWNKV